jgi:hypothetical protein
MQQERDGKNSNARDEQHPHPHDAAAYGVSNVG